MNIIFYLSLYIFLFVYLCFSLNYWEIVKNDDGTTNARTGRSKLKRQITIHVL